MAQPDRRVLVVTGDGEMLMGLGSLVSIGVQQPNNLALVVCDNEHYGETGMQATATAADVDLPGMAAAAGFATAKTVRSANEFGDALPDIRTAPGPLFYDIKIQAEDLPFPMPPKDGVTLKDRFRVALLGAETALAASQR
jgi:thiamine pyrophosphate-dependent acetolactate synthase large subunit-like protein